MLNKLFKLEFKWVNKFALYFGGGALLLGLASRLTTDLTSVAGVVVHNTLQSLAISAAVGLIANVLARSITRFRNTLIKDEAYLLRTLPVEPSVHWNSHVLSFALSMLICLITLLGVLALLFMDAKLWETIKNLFADNTIALIFLALTLIFEITTLGLSIFTGTILGRRTSKNRNCAIAFYTIAFYWGAQLLLLGLAYVLGQLFPSFANIFSATDDMPFLDVTKTFQNFFVLSGLFYALFSVVLYFVGKHALQKGVDVD